MKNRITSIFKKSNYTTSGVKSVILNITAAESVLPLAGYIITCMLCYLYVFLMGNGLRAVYGDTWVYTDLAKRIAFNHSLHMDCVVNDVIYPPLYSALISFAYIFREQAAIFEAIKIVNILVYASAFIPMYYLLKRYASLSRTQSFIGAILLLINTYSLGYIFYITSEPLYIPLIVWLAWFIADIKHLKSKWDVLVFIFIFVSIPLTRALGNVVFPSFVGATIVRYVYDRRNHSRENTRMLAWRSVFIVIASLVIMLLYNIYLRSVVPSTQTDITGGYLSFLNHPNIFKPSYWLDRTAFSYSWMLIATGTVGVPLIISIVIRNPRIIYEDYLASLFLFALLSTFILVALFTAPGLTCDPYQRYYDPLIFLFMVVLFKYIHLIALKDLFVAGVMTLLFSIGAPPFPLYIIADNLASIISNVWAVYVYIYVVAGALLACMLWVLYRYKKYFVNVFYLMMAVSIPVLFWMKGDMYGPNMFGFNDENGIVEQVLTENSATYKQTVIVDRSWRASKFWLEYNKIMIDLPIVPVFKEINDGFLISKNKERRVLLLTHQTLRCNAKKIKGKIVSLYLVE